MGPILVVTFWIFCSLAKEIALGIIEIIGINNFWCVEDW